MDRNSFLDLSDKKHKHIDTFKQIIYNIALERNVAVCQKWIRTEFARGNNEKVATIFLAIFKPISSKLPSDILIIGFDGYKLENTIIFLLIL